VQFGFGVAEQGTEKEYLCQHPHGCAKTGGWAFKVVLFNPVERLLLPAGGNNREGNRTAKPVKNAPYEACNKDERGGVGNNDAEQVRHIQVGDCHIGNKGKQDHHDERHKNFFHDWVLLRSM